MSPLVSIILPFYKDRTHVREALDSVAAQDYPEWEIVSVDDCGNDGSFEIVEAFQEEQPQGKVKIVRHAENRGVAIARRSALDAASGTLLAFLDADDQFFPSKLSVCVERLTAQPCVLVHHSVRVIGDVLDREETKRLEAYFGLGRQSRLYRFDQEAMWLRRNHICNSSVVCRREFALREYFPEAMRFQTEDWVLWNGVSRHGLFYFECTELGVYRYHSKGYSYGSTTLQDVLAHVEMCGCTAKFRARLRDRLVLIAVLLRDISRLIVPRRASGVWKFYYLLEMALGLVYEMFWTARIGLIGLLGKNKRF